MKSLFNPIQTAPPLLRLVSLLVCSPLCLHGAAYIQCLDVGGNVVCTVGGTLDLSTLSIGSSSLVTTGANPNVPVASSYFIIGSGGAHEFVTGLPSAPSLGPGTSFFALGSSTGATFGWDTVTLRLPDGTTPGVLDLDALNITGTFTGTTVAGLGLADNTTTTIYTDIGGISGNNLTFFANTPIPEPSSSLLIVSLLGVFVCRRNRRTV